MKRLHRKDLYGWSVFNEPRDIDFNAVLWVRPDGNVLVDPLPLTPHDRAHLGSLGGAKWIVVTNSDHTRAAEALAAELGATICGPRAEEGTFPIRCGRWLGDGEEIVPGLVAYELDGSKTPGELALALERTTLLFGDLVRAHRAGSLMFLPPDKLADAARASLSVRRLVERHAGADTVLVGDGFSAFGNAWGLLHELLGLGAPESAPQDHDGPASHESDSGQYEIPANRASIPVPRAGTQCSFCDATERRLVSGMGATGTPVAICASCAARLTPVIAAVVCDFCGQLAPETVHERGATVCKDCIDLALTIFGDADG